MKCIIFKCGEMQVKKRFALSRIDKTGSDL